MGNKVEMTKQELQDYAKSWVNCNLNDGEDRSHATADSFHFNAPDLYEVFEDLAEDIAEEFSDDG